MTTLKDTTNTEFGSATAYAINELQIYGYRPFVDEADPRPLPEVTRIKEAVADIFDALVATFEETRLEPDLPALLWSTVNCFHLAVSRAERDLDKNEISQKISSQEQDGSEVKSVELERLTAEGLSMVERRNVMEILRDIAAEAYEFHIGNAWLPRSSSLVSHKNMTAAIIDSRDFIAARKQSEQQIFIPHGTKIALSGGVDFNDHHRIWNILDKLQIKYPDLVLLHGGSQKGAEHIAKLWARNRNIPQIEFLPDWKHDNRAAPFRRNDKMLAQLPVGCIIFQGSGIQNNLADKARKLGIKVWKVGGA
ncbi:DUF2493 domain-containing protein [Bartonella sp. LJL80]